MRILNPQDNKRIYYFAFGANLCPEILEQRRMTIYETIDYILEDADLRFTQSGFMKDHAYASADAAVGKKVYGKLYLIKQSDAKRMDYFEGTPFLGVHDKIFNEYNGSPFYYYRAVSPTPKRIYGCHGSDRGSRLLRTKRYNRRIRKEHR